MLGISIDVVLVVSATIIGPILAVQAQKFIESLGEGRGRKLRLFYTLMGTRAARVNIDHVRALNMIDLEFYGRKTFGFRVQFRSEKAVIDAWRIYQDHLNQPRDPTPPEGAALVWVTRGDELFTELLFHISKALGFDFDRVQLRRGIYSPQAHSQEEQAALAIRDGLARLLSGAEPLKMSIAMSDEDLERQRQVQAALLAHLRGEHPIKVTIEGENRPELPRIRPLG